MAAANRTPAACKSLERLEHPCTWQWGKGLLTQVVQQGDGAGENGAKWVGLCVWQNPQFFSISLVNVNHLLNNCFLESSVYVLFIIVQLCDTPGCCTAKSLLLMFAQEFVKWHLTFSPSVYGSSDPSQKLWKQVNLYVKFLVYYFGN